MRFKSGLLCATSGDCMLKKEHLRIHYLQKAPTWNSSGTVRLTTRAQTHALNSKHPSASSSKPVSLVVVFILIWADQLVGAGLVSQQAQVLQ